MVQDLEVDPNHVAGRPADAGQSKGVATVGSTLVVAAPKGVAAKQPASRKPDTNVRLRLPSNSAKQQSSSTVPFYQLERAPLGK